MADKDRSTSDGLPNELHGEQRSLEALRAHQLGSEPGHETPGRTGEPAEGVLTQVCMQCGKQYVFDTDEPPPEMTCDKCGNRVFRSFFSVVGEDDVDADFREATERDTATNDDAGDVTRGDILDLKNL